MIDDFRSSTVWEMSEYLGPKKLPLKKEVKYLNLNPKIGLLIPYILHKIKLFQFSSLRLWKKLPTLMC